MASHALEHYLEHAAQTYLPRFDAWFPSSFDWRRLCADAPAMVRAAGHDIPDLERERRLQEMAAAVFQASHMLSLALLCAAAEGTDDPDVLLSQLARGCEEEEEEAFDGLVAESLGEVEERLSALDEGPAPGSEDVERAVGLVDVVMPAVTHAMGADASGTFQEAGEAADVLWGVARLASILAALRWMAAEREVDGWPLIPLDA